LSQATQEVLTQLHDDEILDLHDSAYRASHIALYSAFATNAAPHDFADASSDNEARRSSDIRRESR
jgi:hypothetical protein